VQPTIATSASRINARRFHSAVLHNRSAINLLRPHRERAC
jgi:hypothetical protein